MIGCSDDDYKLLMDKQFIIFDTGVIVIRHCHSFFLYLGGTMCAVSLTKRVKNETTDCRYCLAQYFK